MERPRPQAGPLRVRRPGGLDRLVTVPLGVGVCAIAVLHVLRRDLSPVGDRLSLYAGGAHAWLLAVAFLAMTVALLGLALGLWTQRHRVRRAGAVAAALSVAALGMALSGAFPTAVSATSERIHSRASAVAVLSLVAAAAVWSVPRLRGPSAGVRDRAEGWSAVAVGLFAATSSLLHHTPLTGLAQRALWAAVAVWLLTAARPGIFHGKFGVRP